MLSLDDKRWSELNGGRRIPFDRRLSLAKLDAGQDKQQTWHELWDGLYHQGDVGEASYAAVPHLASIYRQRGETDGNTFALIAIIELARLNEGNPELPAWVADDYLRAVRELAEIGTHELSRTTDPDVIRPILAVVAITLGLREHGRILVNYSDREVAELFLE
ncbi:MAG TPA: hypothetical protein VMF66_09940 [Candidatus Acidoferrum sp.]|nr:hypothetical protein [Candidatus Acidoferrum sp.]